MAGTTEQKLDNHQQLKKDHTYSYVSIESENQAETKQNQNIGIVVMPMMSTTVA